MHVFVSCFCAGADASKDNGGYLMKRRSMTQPWTCVHGGTSATLVALMEGRTLLTANVGDSSALLAMSGRRLEVKKGGYKEGGRAQVWAWRRLVFVHDASLLGRGGGGTARDNDACHRRWPLWSLFNVVVGL